MRSPANARRLLDAMERLEAGQGHPHDLIETDRTCCWSGTRTPGKATAGGSGRTVRSASASTSC
ncbi:hypothetical protein BN11_350004 [Nostocoides australiense Ben110]|uniref:Uncharacterized protein n=1 Tax=Nostocoides australiense Ben110 TaxID=1193182 RepID=W6JXT4_9MICO|nr:hypothetical protein BN11_350004 [Tetrasphaera australiensis Ben110]